MLKKRAITVFSVLCVLLVGAGATQSSVLCIEIDGDISVDRAGACSCNWGADQSGGGYARLESYSSEERVPGDGCDPCTDIPLKIEAVHVKCAASYLQDPQPKTTANTDLVWTKSQVNSAPPIREVQPVFPNRYKVPIYARIASLLI
jgi:hypothetical protein